MIHTRDTREQDIGEQDTVGQDTGEQDIGEQDTRKGCSYISCMGGGMLICRGYPESE